MSIQGGLAMNHKNLLGIVFFAAISVQAVGPASARSIRADTGSATGTPNGNGWADPSAMPVNFSALPAALMLPDGSQLLINPFSVSNPVALSALTPTTVDSGWTISALASPSVIVFPSSDVDINNVPYYYDAQTYPYYLSLTGTPLTDSYYVTSPVFGLDWEWWNPSLTTSVLQVVFFSLGTFNSDPTISTGAADVYDSLGVDHGPAVNAWELEFNCPAGGCLGGASLLWKGGTGAPVLYTATPTPTQNVLTATSLTFNGSVLTSPDGGSLLNEFVFNNNVLYPPPGWQATVIAIPTGLAAASGSGAITLNWIPSLNATSYSVYQGASAGGENSVPVQTSITASSATIGGLAAGQKYFFKISAVYNGVDSGPSAEASTTVLPSIPTNLKATASAASIALNWAASVGASSYSLSEGTSSGAENSTPIASGISNNSYTVTGLTAGHKYFFKVMAINAGGRSAASNEATTTVLAPPPGALTASAGNGSVTLSWPASTGATSYNIYQGTSANSENSAPVKPGLLTTTATITGLSNGQAYFFKAAAVDAGGTSALSGEASATPMAPASHGGGSFTVVELMVGALLVIWRSLRGKTSACKTPRHCSPAFG
jgi:fibronectin type 3 domain-containing protein